jgi:hypothetical protein
MRLANRTNTQFTYDDSEENPSPLSTRLLVFRGVSRSLLITGDYTSNPDGGSLRPEAEPFAAETFDPPKPRLTPVLAVSIAKGRLQYSRFTTGTDRLSDDHGHEDDATE